MSVMPRRSARIAAALAATLVGASLSLLGAAPQAVAADPVPAPALTWKISQQFVNNMPVHTFDGGASETAGVVTFPNGAGSYNATNGTATISYSGSVKGAFKNASCAPGDGTPDDTTCYWVKFANPTVTVADGGEGTISAEVSSASYLASGGVQPGSTGTQRVVLTTFDATSTDWVAGSTYGSLTRTPDFENVIAPNSQTATDLGLPAGQPLAGGAFAATLIQQLYPSVRSHFYWSTSQAVNKVAAPFTAEAPPMKVTKKVTAVSPTGGLTLQITGTGFRAVTNPGDAGVYVGVAEAGTSPTSPGGFLVADWVMPAQIVGGAFTKTLTVTTASLDPLKSYSIYTLQAHAHSNTSQDTTTALPINVGQLQNAPSTVVVVNSSTHDGGVAVGVTGSNFVAATNPGDAGVYVGIAEAGTMPDVTSQDDADKFVASDWVMPAQIVSGAFTKTLVVPTAKLDASKSYAVYTWQAHAYSNTSQNSQTAVPIDFTSLVKAPVIGTGGPAGVKYGAGAVLTVNVPGTTGGTVQLKRGAIVVTSVALDSNGSARYTVPKAQAAGSYTYTFAYAGDAGTFLGAAQGTKTLAIAKAAATESLRVPVKATRTKRGQAVIRLTPTVAGSPAVTGKVQVRLVRAGKVRIVLAQRTLVRGAVTISLPKLGKGTWTVRANYLGSSNNLTTVKTLTFKVR